MAAFCFPRWTERLDPTLEASRTNRYFQLFNDRLPSRRGMTFRVFDWVFETLSGRYRLIRGAVWGAIELTAPVLFLLVYIRGPITVLSSILLIVSLLIWHHVSRWAVVKWGSGVGGWTLHRKSHKHEMPKRLGHVVSPYIYHESGCIDLWMSGATGREIVEALYLEHRRHTWWFGLGIAFFTSGVFLVHCILRILDSPLGFVILLPALGYLTLQLARFLLIGGIQVSSRSLIRRMSDWVGERMVFRSDYRIDAISRSPGLIMIPLLSLVFPYLFITLSEVPGYASVVVGFRTVMWIVAAISCLAIGWVLQIKSKERREIYTRAYRRLLDRAAWPYNHFMSFVVLRDPAGADWSWKCYGELPRQFFTHSQEIPPPPLRNPVRPL